jgi:hypothetical protein
LGDDYFGAIDTSFLTKARPESNAAQPELIEIQKKTKQLAYKLKNNIP